MSLNKPLITLTNMGSRCVSVSPPDNEPRGQEAQMDSEHIHAEAQMKISAADGGRRGLRAAVFSALDQLRLDATVVTQLCYIILSAT